MKVPRLSRRKCALISLASSAVLLVGAIGFAVPSYGECRRPDVEAHRKLDDIDLVVIYGGHKAENAVNGYKLAETNGSLVLINGNERELEVARRARRELGFPEERVIEMEAETTLSAAVGTYKFSKEHGFDTISNVSSSDHLITVETLNSRLPGDVSHEYDATPDYNKFGQDFRKLECTTQDSALRTANLLGDYDSWFGRKIIRIYNTLAPIGRKLTGGHPPTE